MKLSQYPAAIAATTQRVNLVDQQLADAHRAIAQTEGEADVVVAFAEDLRNDSQRKARRFELLQTNPAYQQQQDRLIQLSSDRANALAHLEYLRNQFSAAKLETRWAIAEKLASLEARELVGL